MGYKQVVLVKVEGDLALVDYMMVGKEKRPVAAEELEADKSEEVVVPWWTI